MSQTEHSQFIPSTEACGSEERIGPPLFFPSKKIICAHHFEISAGFCRKISFVLGLVSTFSCSILSYDERRPFLVRSFVDQDLSEHRGHSPERRTSALLNLII
jgi:hypothetical protein